MASILYFGTLAGISPWLLDDACARHRGPPPENPAAWLPWGVGEERLRSWHPALPRERRPLPRARLLRGRDDPRPGGGLGRKALSREVCRRLDRRNGGLKDMSARVVMLRRDGVIVLPPPRQAPTVRPCPVPRGPWPPNVSPIPSPWSPRGRRTPQFVSRGYSTLPGAQMRYFVRAVGGEPLAVLGFGAAAWKIAPQLVGWDSETRHLLLTINKARFLILPWPRIPRSATPVRRPGMPLRLLEIFCETPRWNLLPGRQLVQGRRGPRQTRYPTRTRPASQPAEAPAAGLEADPQRRHPTTERLPQQNRSAPKEGLSGSINSLQDIAEYKSFPDQQRHRLERGSLYLAIHPFRANAICLEIYDGILE